MRASQLPETILQFGSGKFLRGFADLFIHQANEQGQQIGRIVVVQTTGDARANLLTDQGGRYHVAVRGLSGGQIVDRIEESASISRALFAARQWPEVLEVARSPQLRWIISNTSEAGYNLDPGDGPQSAPPASFPAKLLRVLHERFQSGQAGVHLLPCELFEYNADTLRKLLLQLAETLAPACRFRRVADPRLHLAQRARRSHRHGPAGGRSAAARRCAGRHRGAVRAVGD